MSLVDSWSELRTLVESIEVDVKKHASGNKSAGVRARRGLRLVKQAAANLVKLSMDSDRDTSTAG